MSFIDIPEKDLKAVAKFFNLDDARFNKVIGSLKKLSVGASEKKIISAIEAVLKDTNLKAIHVGQIILKLFYTISRYDLGESFVSELYKMYIKATESGTNKLSKPAFHDKFWNFYNKISSVAVTTKAQILRSDHERIFNDCRIYTDIRTVFDPSNPRVINGSVIFHILKMEYDQGSNEFSDYFALDSLDLLNLKNAIDRALKKEKQLATNLEKTKLKVIKI